MKAFKNIRRPTGEMHFIHKIYCGFFSILVDTPWVKHPSLGAWWLSTISSLHYILAAYFIVGHYVRNSPFEHAFPSKVVVVVVTLLFVLIAGIRPDNAWFGASEATCRTATDSAQQLRCKLTAVLFAAIGLIINYGVVALIFI